jgi:hypothetical protein
MMASSAFAQACAGRVCGIKRAGHCLLARHRRSHPSPPGEGPREAREWGEASGKRTISPPDRSLRSRPPSPRGEGWHRPSGERAHHYRFTFQTARQASVSAPGNRSAPGRRPSCPPRKQSRRVKRRKALVRNAAPVGHLTVRPVPSSEGTAGQLRRPARLAALHRGDFREA